MLRENLKLRNIKFGIIALICSVTFVSCDDAINVDPADEIVESNAILNVDDVDSAVTGVYGTMAANNAIYWNALITDELHLPTSNNGQGIQVHTWAISSGDGTANGIFSNYYRTINTANRVLAAIPGITPADADEEATLNSLEGQLLAIRGWAHFKLLTYFSSSYTNDAALGVPYLDYVVVLEKPARNTVGEVFAGIASDLTTAASLIPTTFTDNVLFTRDAVTALEARIALYREDFPTAISKSSGLISDYALATTTNYPDIWQDVNDDENIFKLARVVGDGAVGQLFNANSVLIYWVASDKLTAMYDPADVRLSSFIQSSDNKILKYPGDVANVGLNHIKEFRISEQYLIRAEAYARSSQIGLAEDDINELRGNRIPGAVDVTFSGETDAVDQILEERYRELAFEGHRFLDLKRLGKGIERNSSDCDILAATACSMSNSDHRFTLPIPQAEIFTNPNMEPNPGY
mgnify:CR=1 FL=1